MCVEVEVRKLHLSFGKQAVATITQPTALEVALRNRTTPASISWH